MPVGPYSQLKYTFSSVFVGETGLSRANTLFTPEKRPKEIRKKFSQSNDPITEYPTTKQPNQRCLPCIRNMSCGIFSAIRMQSTVKRQMWAIKFEFERTKRLSTDEWKRRHLPFNRVLTDSQCAVCNMQSSSRLAKDL